MQRMALATGPQQQQQLRQQQQQQETVTRSETQNVATELLSTTDAVPAVELTPGFKCSVTCTSSLYLDLN